MFFECNGASFTMNVDFNLPQGISFAKNFFGHAMFSGCNGESFTMNRDFNLPPNIKSDMGGFGGNMFSGCNGPSFTVNSAFKFPVGLKDNLGDQHDTAFERMFYNIANDQSVKAADIINGLPNPVGVRSTFYTAGGNSVWSDYDSLDASWTNENRW
jgi:hypothetical protein